jgi:hypothetical protein
MQLKLFNDFHTTRQAEVARLKRDLETHRGDPSQIVSISSQIEKWEVMNVEVFKLTEDLRRKELWLENPDHWRSAHYSKVAAEIQVLSEDIQKRIRENIKYKPTAMKYEDILIQMRFDGFADAEKYTALAKFPTDALMIDVVSWLRLCVLDMDLLAPADHPECLPFYLNRNGLLDPKRTISSVCSAPTATITCRLKLRDQAGHALPFACGVKGAEDLNVHVPDLFPKRQFTQEEIEKRAALLKSQIRTHDRATYDRVLQEQLKFQESQAANRPVLWRFCKRDGKVEEGRFSCDKLRNFLNQGHFDDPENFGQLLQTYEFSFDGATWSRFPTHSNFLARVNAEATARALDAINCTIQATIAAARLTFRQLGVDAQAQVDAAHNSLSFILPSMPEAMISAADKVVIFNCAVDEQKKKRLEQRTLPPFCFHTCEARPAESSSNGAGGHMQDAPNHIRVDFTFPSFLSLDLIMREQGGLQLALESVIFDLYFQQKLALPRGGAEVPAAPQLLQKS